MNKAFELPQDAKKGDYLVITREGVQVVPRNMYLAIAGTVSSEGMPSTGKRYFTPMDQQEQEKKLILGVLKTKAGKNEGLTVRSIGDILNKRVERKRIPARLHSLKSAGLAWVDTSAEGVNIWGPTEEGRKA